jgi:hypothetical protein
MAVHLINPSDNSFGTAVITPRWLFVLAAATPASMGDPILVDESLEQLDPNGRCSRRGRRSLRAGWAALPLGLRYVEDVGIAESK